ncbi:MULTISPECIES: hypothetical protein [unclassified Synechococcus]|uniref:hypothetical protein n=1 Tax=unclassified Synechococcus TaxID=2626047 RepID=UPI0012E9CB1F|nr:MULTISPECIES: hypothetical protein [unclassified Synechococcus]MCP9826876.1 hypothetical protein [Synechococcus sp. EJ6-Ellesmere]WFN58113.1 hypothetical protein N4320_09765 [Synechococcus sp. CCFWC 502]
MSQQPALADGVDTLVCDGKTLRGSIDQKPGAAASFIAQVSLYSQPLGVAIAQTTYATDESSETASLLWLLSGIELTDMLVQADEVGGSRSSRGRQAGPSSPAPAAGGAAAPPGWYPGEAGATSKSGCWLLPVTASAEPLALSRER